jgi:transglutaminase-like putative cysteine protease
VPARYVSGYILTRPPPGQPKLQGADASHAWIAVWAPDAGWVDFDPTNGMVAGEEHIAIAHGRDYDDVSPISGVLIGGGEHTVTVAVDVVEAA